LGDFGLEVDYPELSSLFGDNEQQLVSEIKILMEVHSISEELSLIRVLVVGVTLG
jgi:hypothetical protein